MHWFYRAWCVVTAPESSSGWMEIAFQVPCIAHLLLKALSIFLGVFVGTLLGLTLLLILTLFPSKEMRKKITVLLNTISTKNSWRIPLRIFYKEGILVSWRKISLGQSLSLLEESIHLSHAKVMTDSLIEDYAIPEWVSIMTRQLGKYGALKAGSRSFTELKIWILYTSAAADD